MNPPSTVEYGFRRVIITITVILCSLLELIDTSIVNVATTNLMGNLGATLGEVSWIIAAYGIANVIVVPMSGWFSAQFGRRNYYVGSVILFTVASVLCGNSTSIWELAFFRFVQGVGGGALLATSQTILTEIYPAEKRGMASAMFGMGVIMGPTLGPLLGGYLIDNFEWPMIFYVNLPVGVVAAITASIYIKNSKPERAAGYKVDFLGMILLIVGIGSLQMVLEQGDREDWFESQFILSFTIVAVLGVLFFIWRELTVEHPIVDLRVFKKGNVAIGTVLSFILGLGLYASVFIYPVYVQRFLGFTALQTGMSLLPGALASGMMMPIVGILLSKGVSPKILIPIGFISFFAFTQMCTYIISPITGQDDFFYALLVRGLGLGMLFVPLTTLSLTGLQGKDIASASGITSMMRQLGGAFSVALVSVFSEHTTQQHRLDLLSNVTPYNPNAMERLATYTNAFTIRGNGNATQQAYMVLDNVVSRQAMILTYKDVFLYLGIFFICCMPIVFLAKSVKAGKVDLGAAH